jgi:hypothetical protein
MTPRQIAKRILYWQSKLGLGSWDIRYSPVSPEDDERASCLFDVRTKYGAVCIAKDAPVDQVDRLIVHELLHMLMGEMQDCFDRSVGSHQEEARSFLEGQWLRSQEWVLERLADTLTGSRRIEFGDDVSHVWKAALPR